jgi:peptidoglycan hydrolase-like protein with peptidoglycan-binding domain
MKKYFVGVMCASVLALMVVAPVAQAQTATTTPTVASLMEILQGLLKQVEELQKKLRETQGEIQAVQREIKSGLREGATDEDVKKIQELLASDNTLYPRGLITGYYGPLTSEAVKRFQERNGLTVTGIVDDETRDYLEEYYTEYKANRGAAALWAFEKRDAMKKRIEERKKERDMKKEEKKEYKNDDDDDDDDRPATTTKAMAERAILAATTAIDDLEEALEDSTADEDDVEDATEDLEDAKDNLAKAKRALNAANYRLAYDYAMKAREDARDGLEELSDDDDDDDDEEDDD